MTKIPMTSVHVTEVFRQRGHNFTFDFLVERGDIAEFGDHLWGLQRERECQEKFEVALAAARVAESTPAEQTSTPVVVIDPTPLLTEDDIERRKMAFEDRSGEDEVRDGRYPRKRNSRAERRERADTRIRAA